VAYFGINAGPDGLRATIANSSVGSVIALIIVQEGTSVQIREASEVTSSLVLDVPSVSGAAKVTLLIAYIDFAGSAEKALDVSIASVGRPLDILLLGLAGVALISLISAALIVWRYRRRNSDEVSLHSEVAGVKPKR